MTYLAGEWSTFNAAVKVMEKFYGQCNHPLGAPILLACIQPLWFRFIDRETKHPNIPDRPLPRTEKPWSEIQKVLEAHAEEEELAEEAELAQVDEMMVMSCMAVPKEKTLRQRAKFFAGIGFRGLQHLLQDAQGVDFI